jgi:hypothetical protein|tara:strand:- start:5333 stop:5836 length:504 start_codon:yes stop_codon:yes gene_type:complete
MAYLFEFNTVLGRLLFVIVILIATHFHILAGVITLMLIISYNHNVIEGMENKEDLPDKTSNEHNESDDGVTDLNGDNTEDPISTFKKENCKDGLLMKDDKEVTKDSITSSFPDLKFLEEPCNPCDDDCKFEIVSSSERLTAEKNVRPVDSTTIPVDRENITKKQDEQ